MCSVFSPKRYERLVGQKGRGKEKGKEGRTCVKNVDESRVVLSRRRKGFTAENEDAGTSTGHRVAGSSIWRWTHILKHEPSLICVTKLEMIPRVSLASRHTSDLESSQIPKVLAVNTTTTKDVNNIVNQRSGMSLSGYGDITYAGELLPCTRIDIEGPSVVVMIRSIRTAESKHQASVSFSTSF